MTASDNKRPPLTAPKLSVVLSEFSFKRWLYAKRYYLLAFLIPCGIMYAAYCFFGFYPFGDRSVLVLDLNGQYVYYFEYIRRAFWGEHSMLYSWSRNLSGEFLGIAAYYLASPFTLIVMLLPRSMILGSLLIMQLAKLGAIGCAMMYYLDKSRGIKGMPALMCSLLYSLCAYAVYQLMDPMWLDGLMFMPLIAVGLERLLDTGKKTGYIVPLAMMFIANFYIGWMCGFFTFFYFIYYITVGTDRTKRKPAEFVRGTLRFGISTIIACMCAAFMLLAVYSSLSLGKLEFSTPDYSFKLQFKAFDMLTKLLPCSYDTVRNVGLPAIYCGILTVLAVPLYYMNSEIPFKKKIGSTFLLAVVFFSMYIKPVDICWHGFQVPNWLPYRYSFLFSFILLTMAATALDKIKSIGFGEIGAVFFGIIALIIYMDTSDYDHVHTGLTVWVSIGFASAFCVLLHIYRKHPRSVLVSTLMLLFICGELLLSSWNTIEDIHKDVTYSKHSSYYTKLDPMADTIDMLYEKDNSFYRSEKTWHRTVNDALAIDSRSITHSSSTMNSRVIDFIEKLGFTTRGHYSRYCGETPASDMILGIKYVLDNDSGMPEGSTDSATVARGKLVPESYEYSFRNDDIFCFENPYYIGMGFAADKGIEYTQLLVNKNPFETQNTILSSLTGVMNDSCFTKLKIDDRYFCNVEEVDAIDQMRYKKTSTTGDSYIDFIVTAKDTNPVYFFIPTKYEKQVNIWTKSEWLPDEEKWRDNFTGCTDMTFVSKYYETQFYHVMKLGNFSAGQKFCLRMSLLPDNDCTYMQGSPLFYSFEGDKLAAICDKLRDGAWNITEYSDTYLRGTVNIKEDQVLYTSIPNEPGWTVKVDGKETEIMDVYDSLIAVKMEPGEHEVEMTYLPEKFTMGLVISGIGIAITVVIYLYDNSANLAFIVWLRKRLGKNAEK